MVIDIPAVSLGSLLKIEDDQFLLGKEVVGGKMGRKNLLKILNLINQL
jgi:hypothetical protein